MKKISTLTTFATFAFTIVGVGLIAILAYVLIHQLQQEHLANEKKQALEITNKALVLPVWNYDESYIQEIIGSFIDDENKNIVAIKIIMRENKREFVAKSPFIGHSIENLKTLRHVDVLRDTILYQGRELGTLEVYFSSARFIDSFNRVGALILFLTFLLAIALAFLMNHYIKKLLTKPLREIAKDAKKAGQGQYDINFKTNYTGELNIVTEAFNDTLYALKERDRLLIRQNALLEELVDKRTKERDEERLKSFQASRLASLGEMASAIAHEINNPLTIIQNYSKTIGHALEGTNRQELVQKSIKIQNMSDRIARIIKGLRSFSRDGQNDQPQIYSVNRLIEDLACLCSSRAKDMDIDLQFESTGHDDYIYVNVTQIGQVLINLINNSIDAIEFQNNKWIKVKIDNHSSQTKITVTDSGKGISSALQDKIMDPFFTTKDPGKGTGLGLSISQRIIIQHGGEFIYNSSSKNTEFIITLPRLNKDIQNRIGTQ